ncbi:F-box only protein 7-like [Leptopilina heterotoma]|uniref:F-box only protein 7-like n=1 Tax=Leptopilina heterotoma TaxID=63436 RepID=UPI001CA7D9E6|nr:F-box only protein 7-like [Leptopilina heterotoma]
MFYSARCSIKSLRIPENWKTDGIYRIAFRYNIGGDFTCKLVAIPVGDKIVLNFSSRSLYCIVLQTLKYINPHSSEIGGKFWNLKEFSYRLKNEILTPLRVELLTAFGLPSPSLLGVPEEVKSYIFKMLDSRSKKSLLLCCPRFSNVYTRRR